MRFQSSFGGAYDEALESSAEKIMLVVSQDYNRDNCSSGYSSDTEASEGQETESYSIADEPSSLSCSSSCASLSSSTSSSCGETSDIECEIEFLQEKQALLKRAVSALKSMEAYDASKARAVLNGTLPSGSPLWAEAKEVLEILNDNSSGGIRTTAAQTSTDKPPDAKRPRIDVSSVVCLSSNNIGNNVLAPSSWNRAIPAKPFACTGAWMAQVMAHFISSLSRQHDSTSTPSADSWEVISDPDLGLLVLPPPKLPFQNGVQLKDALGFTSVAQ